CGEDPELVALDLGADTLRTVVPDELPQFLGVVLRDTLLQVSGDLVLATRGTWFAGVQRLQAHSALDQLLLEHIEHGLDAVLRVRLHLYRFTGPGNRRPNVLEVEPLPDLPGRLVQRIVDLLPIDLAHDVE